MGLANDYATRYCIRYKNCKIDYGGGGGLKINQDDYVMCERSLMIPSFQ